MTVQKWLVATALAGGVTLGAAVQAQEIEIRFGTTNPPGGMQYLSGETTWLRLVWN
jgi:hypothetical protein